MAVTKGRFQTHQNKSQPLPWSVVDTEGATLGERFMCACRDEIKATVVAGALNFNLNPGEYGYKLETGEIHGNVLRESSSGASDSS